MTHSTIAKSFAIAAVTVLALSVAPTAKADDKGCSNASLIGTFAVTTTGYSVAAPDPVGPAFAQVSMQTFGAGVTTNVGMTNSNGTVAQANNTGTFTVNPDCTGTFTLSGAKGPSTWFFVISDNWNEIRAICVDPFAVLTKVARRIYPGRSM
ncbi:MAG TPA: hypothetical protein VN736_01655 [Candidatus Limnocylindrales bacterium]|nr:hypothetical protein [Candidatus Limnocylindrales bacterium]